MGLIQKENEEGNMRKHLACGCAIMIISIVGFGPAYATGNNSTELQLKMNEISSLQNDLTEKIALAMEKKDQRMFFYRKK